MTLRRRLLLAQAPLASALLLAGIVFLAIVAELGKLGSAILKDNYRSVLAAQRMKDSIERMDRAALMIALGNRAKGTMQAADNREPFDSELGVEEKNITEPGEQMAAAHLRAAWTRYEERLDAFIASPPEDLQRIYFQEMEPAFLDVNRQAQTVLDMNQEAMVRRSDRAARRATSSTELVTVLAILALVAGVLTSTWLTSRLLRPLDSLGSAVRQIAAGDLAARAAVVGRDELSELASEFNAMAEHLAKYRESSLGALLAAQQASRAAIDSLPDPVIVLDLESNVTESNEAARQLLRLDALPRGQNAITSAPPELRTGLEQVRDHVLSGKGPYVPRGFDEAVRLSKSEGDMFLLARATPLYGDDRMVDGVTIVLQDVSKLRRLDELRNDLVATVAHEFRTPLTSLQMAIHLCVEQAAGPITERQADLLYAARDDCLRLQTIVDELLNLARLQRGAIELRREAEAPRSLLDQVVTAFEMQTELRSIRISVSEEPTLPRIAIDIERAKIVLTNLLANAIRHSPDHATVAVRARRDSRGVRFEVADEGPGIPLEHRDRVFDRFFRVPGAKTGGAGLGLSIAREIVEAHGGAIGLDAPDAGGCVFWFTMPCAEPCEE